MSTKSSYARIAALDKAIDIIEYLHQQGGPVTAAEIARSLGIPQGTVMCHLATLLDRKWLRMTGDCYEPGVRLAGMYSAYKMGIENKISALSRELTSLEA